MAVDEVGDVVDRGTRNDPFVLSILIVLAYFFKTKLVSDVVRFWELSAEVTSSSISRWPLTLDFIKLYLLFFVDMFDGIDPLLHVRCNRSSQDSNS